MEGLHLRQHRRLRQLALRRGLHAWSALQMARATHDLYEMVPAQAIHHLPPGYHVSIKNGNPCPKELLLSSPDWPGEVAQYCHGTTTHSLLRGIIRDGFKETFGAGGETTARAWGQNTPMVYRSKLLECRDHLERWHTTYHTIRVVLRCIPMGIPSSCGTSTTS